VSVISDIVAVSFIGGENWRKLPTYRKSLPNFIAYSCIENIWPERVSNSHLHMHFGYIHDEII
jgi:hypothetical protein